MGEKLEILKGVTAEYGTKVYDNGINFCISASSFKTLELCIFNKEHRLRKKIDLKPYRALGEVYSVFIKGIDPGEICYTYEKDGKPADDIYAKNALRLRKWGESKKNGKINLNRPYTNTFDWKDDSQLELDCNDIVAYEVHVRGYTKDASSKVVHRGTFLGLTERIDYFKRLAVNQLVLMPAYDFDEVDVLKNSPFLKKNEPSERINFWGFKEARYFMPKPEYAFGDDFVNEFKGMVYMMHEAGIEVIMRFYFPENINRSLILPCLRYWIAEYHIDGFFLMGNDLPIEMIATDGLLNRTKLYYDHFDRDSIFKKKYEHVNGNLVQADSSFMIKARKFLKSDDDTMAVFMDQSRCNPSDIKRLNYIGNYEGFTLNDLVSYELKHNEANGENNTDGSDYNYSWNCGAEGMSRKKVVRELRIKQMKNALIMLFLSRGIPMLHGGDEFLNSQGGNNNPYCQDNEIGWVKFRSNKEITEFRSFVEKLIALRKEHPILHMRQEPKLMDSKSCGYPDISYHGEAAWYPKFFGHIKNIGVMYCGLYASRPDGSNDDFFYVAYNMHWEDHKYALPKLPEGLKWNMVISSDENSSLEYEEKLEKIQEQISIHQRTIVILKSVGNIIKQKRK
ncbi:MAG: hypothetical protein K5931_06075 [Lachnospiraceae bacterium]|nr:hypothetical protein [Lachnospiraceae bacterium]